MSNKNRKPSREWLLKMAEAETEFNVTAGYAPDPSIKNKKIADKVLDALNNPHSGRCCFGHDGPTVSVSEDGEITVYDRETYELETYKLSKKPLENVIVREARTDDVMDVVRILGQMSPMGDMDPESCKKQFDKRFLKNPDIFLWVAEHKGHIVGTAMMHLQYKLSYGLGVGAHLEDVVVDEEYKGLGVGTKLVNKAIEVAKEKKCYKLMLTCWRSTGSIEYYQRFGFEEYDVGMKLTL